MQAATNNTPVTASTAQLIHRFSIMGVSTQRKMRYSGRAVTSNAASDFVPVIIPRKATMASQGVSTKATTVDMLTVRGTFKAIGAI